MKLLVGMVDEEVEEAGLLFGHHTLAFHVGAADCE